MNRNTKSALAAAAVSIAAIGAALLSPRAVWADGESTIEPPPFVGTTTRADVRAQLFKAMPLPGAESYWIEPARERSGVTRAARRTEYMSSREFVGAITGEDSGSAYLKRHPQFANPQAVMGGAPEPVGRPEVSQPSQ